MLELKEVSKKFGNLVILDKMSYSFEQSKIYVIKGKNGVGKTVLLKLICGLMSVDEGEIKYFDERGNQKKCEFGIIIENPIFWKDKTGVETLEFLASIKNKIAKKQIEQTLETVGLKDAARLRTKKYSLGMKQRLAIGQAIMENPDILLFDEPTNSLDDDGVEMFKNIILKEKQEGKIVIIVTHNIEDVNDICDTLLDFKNHQISEVVD